MATTKRERLEEPLAYRSSRRPTHSLCNNNNSLLTTPTSTITFKRRRPNSLTTATRLLFLGFTLLSLILSTAQVSAVNTWKNNLGKRFMASPLCPQLGNGQLYCKPTSGQLFNSTDYIPFAWNTLDNTFAVQGSLDIYLYRLEGNREVRSWPNVPNANTSISVLPSDSWFDTYSSTGNNTYNFFFIATAPNAGPVFTNPGPTFSIRYVPSPSSSTTATPLTTTTQEIVSATATVTAPISSAPSTSNSGLKSQLTPALIAVIACAGLMVLAAIGAVLYAVKTRRRNQKVNHQSLSNFSTSSHTPIVQITSDLKDPNVNKFEPEDASSIHSTTPLAEKNSMSSLTQNLLLPNNAIGVTTTTTSFSAAGHTSPTVTFTGSDKNNASAPAFDAAYISDAYRQVLRKPDWRADDYDDEDEFDTDDGLSTEEKRRRREAKELMKKELAEEGRGIHSVSRRHTKVHNVEDEDENNTEVASGSGSNSGNHGIL